MCCIMHLASMAFSSMVLHLVSEAQLSVKAQLNPVTLQLLRLNSVALCLQHFSSRIHEYLHTAETLVISISSLSLLLLKCL